MNRGRVTIQPQRGVSYDNPNLIAAPSLSGSGSPSETKPANFAAAGAGWPVVVLPRAVTPTIWIAAS